MMKNSKFTVTCDYYATGEGSTRTLLYTNAFDEDAARDNFGRRFGHYLAMGSNVEEGWNFDNNFAELLVTDRVKRALQAKDGMMEYSATLYMNFS